MSVIRCIELPSWYSTTKWRTGGLHASSNNQNTKAGQINEQIAYKMKGWDIDSPVKVALINIHKSCKLRRLWLPQCFGILMLVNREGLFEVGVFWVKHLKGQFWRPPITGDENAVASYVDPPW